MSPHTSSLYAGAFIAEKYRLVCQLGEGAMGVVWRAVNTVTLGEVALKLLHRPEPELRPRLLREAQACCAIQHKNVIRIHDVGQTECGDPFLVMELLSGETLEDLLRRKRRLDQGQAATLARDVARALAAAHEKGIVHRDLKPANLFLHDEPGEETRVLKVLDFGVSKHLQPSDGLLTVAGGQVGSPFYMSPEQVLAYEDIDGRADVWSVGMLLFEMLIGDRPFTGESPDAVMKKILDGDIPTPSRYFRGFPADLDRLVSSCLCRDRQRRPWPASALAEMLEPFATGGSNRSPVHAPAEPSASYAPQLRLLDSTEPMPAPSAAQHEALRVSSGATDGQVDCATLELKADSSQHPGTHAPPLTPPAIDSTQGAASSTAPLLAKDVAAPAMAPPGPSTASAQVNLRRARWKAFALVAGGALVTGLLVRALLVDLSGRVGSEAAAGLTISEPLATAELIPASPEPLVSPPPPEASPTVQEPRAAPERESENDPSSVSSSAPPEASAPVVAPAKPTPKKEPLPKPSKCGKFKVKPGCSE